MAARLRAAGAAAAVAALVLVISGALVLPRVQRGAALLQDDVNHDGALGAVFGGRHAASAGPGARGRRAARPLSKDASVADFFQAAMDGDFSRGGTVKRATDGMFSLSPGGAHKGDRGAHPRKLAARVRGRTQALAETKLHVKAAHAALAREAHADRRALQSERAAGLHMVDASKQQQMLAQIRKREQQLAQKYPSEDKFVARYTGSVPSTDVPVDSFTFGKFVPL